MSDFSDAKVGDRVWSIINGWGKIIEIRSADKNYPIRYEADCGNRMFFTLSGRCLTTDKYQTLFWDEIDITPPPRPKRKVKKKLEGWVNIYPDGIGPIHPTEESAEESEIERVIACVYMSGEYEVEE